MKTTPWREPETRLGFSLRAVIKAIVLATVAYGGLALLVTTVISFYGNLETRLPLLAFVAQYLTALITGIVAGRIAGQSGWVHGLTAGILFMVIVSVAGTFFLPVRPTLTGIILWRILPGALLGLGGGAVGANL